MKTPSRLSDQPNRLHPLSEARIYSMLGNLSVPVCVGFDSTLCEQIDEEGDRGENSNLQKPDRTSTAVLDPSFPWERIASLCSAWFSRQMSRASLQENWQPQFLDDVVSFEDIWA